MIRIVVMAFIMWPALLGVQVAASEPQPKIKISNSLSECVRLEANDAKAQKNLLIVSVHLEVTKSIAGCGCKSGAVRYRTYETYKGSRREMNRGLLNSIPRTGKPDDVLLVLNSDTSIHWRPPFSIDIGCAD